ncbi:mucoidy inhibitor MuiA family protein [Kitasatospora sp. NPDC002040]|uniref:mucoidy inhibitor MuiA family protein n=1 Tax=Kitasatospora sp. NPDC002040 TaxID=3154661 RepID=UPI00331726CA
MTTTTPLPVTAVTCLEDRSLVERSTGLDLAPGVQRLRLGPVTALAADRTLRAELATGSVLDTRITRVWTAPAPQPPTAEDSELRHRVHALEQELTALAAERQRLTARLTLLGQLTADLLREIGEGAGRGETEPARWTRELDRVDAERDTHGERLRSTDARLLDAESELGQARHALALAEEEPPELLGFLELTVDTPGGPNRLTVSHLTPCALWRPAYRATLADDGSLTLETEAVVWQRTGEDWSDVRLTLSTARSALAGEPPRLSEDVLTLRERTAEERRTVEVELREQAIGSTGPAADGLPGVDDGGEVRVLHAPAPARVPGDGRPHRVPLTAFTTPASSEYSCAPELSPLVTRVARFTNAAGHALLAGPVDLVLGSGFTGRAELEFTAPGAPAELSFGSSDAYRVVRETEEARSSAGALSTRTVQTRTVRLHLSRFSGPDDRADQPVTVRERIPVSEVAAVEVRLRKELCSPAPDELDPDGIVRWQLTLPPGGRRTVTLVYEVTATAKVAGL